MRPLAIAAVLVIAGVMGGVIASITHQMRLQKLGNQADALDAALRGMQ